MRVRELRDQFEPDRPNLTQTTLAQLLEQRDGLRLDPSAIARLEKGQRSIRLNEAVAISEIFGLTVDEMLWPTAPADEQLRRADDLARRTELRALFAVAEHDAAQHRLDRLRERLSLGETEGGGGVGEHRATD